MRALRGRSSVVTAVVLLGLVGGLSSLPRTASADDGDRYAHSHKAKDAIKEALEELDNAGHDYGGHKAEAQKQLKEAAEKLSDWDAEQDLKEKKKKAGEAADKVQLAIDELEKCRKWATERGHTHPKIDVAVEELQHAKDELK